MASLETVLEQALTLTQKERGELISRLVSSLEPDSSDDLPPDRWEAAWTSEIDRRLSDVREGRAQLVESADVFRAAREALAARRR